MQINVDEMMHQQFNQLHKQRSAEYKNGFRCILLHEVHGIQSIMPYVIGTAQADAFIAGCHDAKRALERLFPTAKAAMH